MVSQSTRRYKLTQQIYTSHIHSYGQVFHFQHKLTYHIYTSHTAVDNYFTFSTSWHTTFIQVTQLSTTTSLSAQADIPHLYKSHRYRQLLHFQHKLTYHIYTSHTAIYNYFTFSTSWHTTFIQVTQLSTSTSLSAQADIPHLYKSHSYQQVLHFQHKLTYHIYTSHTAINKY
jgi:hypothetical protein